jgi:serine/threonine protein kinase
MAEQTSQHPDQGRLAAFGQGTLDHGEMAEVESHLTVCESCCALLCTLPDDEFVDRLRASQRCTGWAAKVQDDAGGAATAQAASADTSFEVPSSFVYSDLKSGSELPPTVATGDPAGSRMRNLPIEQELPAELLEHPRYQIVRKLGDGGMGSVYLAQHRVMDRPVALKVIRSDLLGKPALVERFRREVKSAAHLALHPNIVAAYDAEQAGESHFLVMEFVDGVNLGDLVKSSGPLSVEAACDVIRQAAEGLEHAHERGMVHRDIKPQNLMRTPSGQIKILDFGLARLASEILPDLAAAAEENELHDGRSTVPEHGIKLTLTDMVLGSADYISPEQALDPRSADIRADVYSLGCTLYHLLAGQPPFPEENLAQKLAAHAERAAKPLSELRGGVPPELIQIVDRMMAKDPRHRFQQPADVAKALAPFCSRKAEHDREDDMLQQTAQVSLSGAEAEAASVRTSDLGRAATGESLKVARPSSQRGVQGDPPPWPTRFVTSWRRPSLVKVASMLSLLLAVTVTVTVPFIREKHEALAPKKQDGAVNGDGGSVSIAAAEPVPKQREVASAEPHVARKRGGTPKASREPIPSNDVEPSPREPNPSLVKANGNPAIEARKGADVKPPEPSVAAKLEAFRKAIEYWSRDFLKKSWDVDRLASDPAMEIALGRELHDVIVDLNPTVEDESVLRVMETAEPLKKLASRKDISYSFTVLDTDAINAFSHPGGYIYVTRGLLTLIAKDESYALEFVLAHEMAHLELRHAIKALQDPGMKKQLGAMGTIQKLYGVIIPSAYPDAQEFEADAWAFNKLKGRLDRSNRECLAFLTKLVGYAASHGFPTGRAKPKPGYSLVDNHFPAHTAPFTRLQHLKELRDALSPSPK